MYIYKLHTVSVCVCGTVDPPNLLHGDNLLCHLHSAIHSIAHSTHEGQAMWEIHPGISPIARV